MKTYYRIGEIAEILKVSTQAVRLYVKKGELECDYTPSGQRVFTQEHLDKYLGKTKQEKRVYYARSSKGSKTAINNQLNELTSKYGEPVKTYTDNGSGLNENRKNLKKLIKDAQENKFDTVHVTHADRLTRFGFSYLEELFSQNGVKIVVEHENNKTLEDELMSDFMSLIASFSGRFYRLRSRENQEKLLDKAKEVLDGDEIQCPPEIDPVHD